MPMETKLSLKYSGPSVDAGLMDVYQASANMIAFSEFMVIAAKTTFGEQVTVKAEVAGFGRGSFLTDLVFNFVGHATPIFASFTTEELLKIVNEAFELWKHLKGEPPKEIKTENHQTAKVTNNNGQIIQVQTQTLNLVFDEKAAEAVQAFIQTPLLRDGIDSLEIGTDGKIVAQAKQDEGHCFGLVRPSESITDTTIQMTLIIEAPVFKDGNKWRFSDGQNSFYADILDLEFLSNVDKGEPFAKGDLLRVDLRITQERAGIKITTERAVIKVHEHKTGQKQHALL